jgi:vancomycin resistance protein YoaR
LGGAALFVAALLTLSLGYRVLYAGRIFPGVSVAGVDVSGLKPDEAAVKINGALTYPYSGRVVFRDGTQLWTETPARLGMVLDPGLTAKTAFGVGRSGILDSVNNQLIAAQVGVAISPVNIFDQRVAYSYLQNLARQIDRPVVEASLGIDGLNVTSQPGQVGRSLNVESTLVYLNAQMQSYRDGEVPLVITEKAPEVLDASAQAEAARRLLSAPLTLSIPDARPGDPGPWQIQPAELVAMLRVGTMRTDTGAQFLLQLDRASLQPKLEEISGQINRKAQDARFIFNDETLQIELI